MMTPHKTTPLTLILAVLALALGGISTANADVGSRNTASYVKAQIDKLDGKKVTLDVLMVRLLRPFTTNENYVLLGVATVDDENRSGGGTIIAVANKEDKDAIIRRFGTTVDRDNGRVPDAESMRGTVHLVDRELGRDYIYLDLTDGAFNPSTEDVREIVREISTGRKGKPGKKAL
ncbi:MAG: hypothetical protein AAGA45_02025 [Verrucomicrobiota bacterium]